MSPSYVTTNTVESHIELMRPEEDARWLFFFSSVFVFLQRCTYYWRSDRSDQWHRQSCGSLSLPSDLSVPSSVSRCVFLPASASPVITSEGLFLSVSYDVLWPCSGSRTVTVLSLCHPIDTPSPCHMRTRCLLECVCVSIIVWPLIGSSTVPAFGHVLLLMSPVYCTKAALSPLEMPLPTSVKWWLSLFWSVYLK